MGIVADGILETGIVIITAKLWPRCAGTAFLLAPHTEEAGSVDQRVTRRHSIGEKYDGFSPGQTKWLHEMLRAMSSR